MSDKSLILPKRNILKLLLLCLLLYTMPPQAIAQDDVQVSKSEDSKFKAENFGFNAIDLQQSRFLYSDSIKYDERPFHDIMRVGVTWRYNKIHPYEHILNDYYRPTLNYGVFIEKELSKLHSLRLSFGGGSYQHISRSTVLNMCQIELQHSFNWVRLFGGYNPYRKIEVVTNLGIGGFCSAPGFFDRFSESFSESKLNKNIEMGGQFTMGAGVRLMLNPLFVLGFDPYVTLTSDNIDHSGLLNHRKYDVLYGTDVSLSYTFRNELSKKERTKYRGNTLVDFGLGAQFQLSSGYIPISPATTTSLPFFSTAGPQFKFGIGHWFSPAVAIRATANFSASNWLNTNIEANDSTLHPSYNIRWKNVSMNTHLDLLFSPYHFFTGRTDNRLDVNTVVGWEYGRMIKTTLRTNYKGFSGGLQFRYIYDKYTSLYIEPRITFANYTIPYAPPYQSFAKHYRDHLFSVTAGMEFVANEYRFLNRNTQPSEFSPHIALSLQGGPNFLFITKEHMGDFYLDYSGALAGEAHFSPYSGIRLMTDYSQISFRDIYNYTQVGSENYFGSQPLLSDTALCTGRYGYINISADYIFDLGTLLQGYNKANRWDVALAIGIVSSHRISHKAIISKEEVLWEFRGDSPTATTPEVQHHRATKHSWGIQFGIPVSYRIAPRLDLQFEPRARLLGPNYVAPNYITGSYISRIINLQLGMRYTF